MVWKLFHELGAVYIFDVRLKKSYRMTSRRISTRVDKTMQVMSIAFSSTPRPESEVPGCVVRALV